MLSVPGRDERRHPPGPEAGWSEGWYFDFVTADGSLGGFAGLALYPQSKTAWYWAALVGVGRRLVMVRDQDIAPPRGESLEIRGGGLWSMLNCETPLDHWSIGLEAFAIALDDPAQAFADERGDRVGLGFDLEWEGVAPPRPVLLADGRFAAVGGAIAPPPARNWGHYEQSCQVHGEVLVGEEQLTIAGVGQRYHRWGVQDWWSTKWRRASGVMTDGTAFSAWDIGRGEGDPSAGGYLVPLAGSVGAVGAAEVAGMAGMAGVAREAAIFATWADGGLLGAGTVSVGGQTLIASPIAHAPMALDGPDGRRARMLRAMCRYRADDGRVGTGWLEWLDPPNGNG